ncbi:Hypothetical predicted protein [Octopus vulgaris]|uniref:Uncharacterized protein n=1 Tax=Octopus vulgaris TaxID=6645 RepID=A0AA36BAL4_OCTVU|nr:Hypothetical predicted protein [Octopus vulgaris]
MASNSVLGKNKSCDILPPISTLLMSRETRLFRQNKQSNKDMQDYRYLYIITFVFPLVRIQILVDRYLEFEQLFYSLRESLLACFTHFTQSRNQQTTYQLKVKQLTHRKL